MCAPCVTGGESGSVAVYIYEVTPAHRRGLMMAVMSASNVGAMLSAATHAILSASCNESFMRTWGWRVPFWLGLGLVVVSMWGQV